mgnify:CR=1 FL=1
MKTQKERLFAFIKAIGFSVREFERTLGVSNGTVRHLSDTLSANIKDKISTNFLQLNINWLLTGNGEMLVVPTDTPRDERPTTEDSSDTAAAYIEKIEQLQAELEQQKEFNALQKEYVMNLKERIAEYQERVAELKEIIHELKKAQHTATVPHAKSV